MASSESHLVHLVYAHTLNVPQSANKAFANVSLKGLELCIFLALDGDEYKLRGVLPVLYSPIPPSPGSPLPAHKLNAAGWQTGPAVPCIPLKSKALAPSLVAPKELQGTPKKKVCHATFNSPRMNWFPCGSSLQIHSMTRDDSKSTESVLTRIICWTIPIQPQRVVLGTLQAEQASCPQDLPDEASYPQGRHWYFLQAFQDHSACSWVGPGTGLLHSVDTHLHVCGLKAELIRQFPSPQYLFLLQSQV